LVARMLKALQQCSSHLSDLDNYFDGSTKLFSDLYVAKYLDASTRPFRTKV